MKRTFLTVFIAALLVSCSAKQENAPINKSDKSSAEVVYPYKATYSSDITVPGKPEAALIVLKIWKMFERNLIDSMRLYYADTVTYEDAAGYYFHGKSDDLLHYAGADVGSLDSMRFDITSWQSVHINDKNEDWVYVWARERRYEKKGKADTMLIHEQWKVENGKVTYFNQFEALPSKKH